MRCICLILICSSIVPSDDLVNFQLVDRFFPSYLRRSSSFDIPEGICDSHRIFRHFSLASQVIPSRPFRPPKTQGLSLVSGRYRVYMLHLRFFLFSIFKAWFTLATETVAETVAETETETEARNSIQTL